MLTSRNWKTETMKILLTGASGFLGGHLAARLSSDGHQVIGLRRNEVEPLSSQLAKRCNWVNQSDFLADPHRALPDLDAVIFLASCYGRNRETYSQISAANLTFPLGLLEQALRASVKWFINTDTALPRNFNSYALTKAQFADWGRMSCQHFGVHFANLRLDHLYGPGDDPTKFSDFIINSCVANVPELALTLGEQQRDFIYIDDVVEAVICTLDALAGARLQGYHEIAVGSGTATSIRDFVELVERLSGADTRLLYGEVPYRPNEVMLSVSDTSTLKALGWRCRVPLEQGLLTTIRSKRT